MIKTSYCFSFSILLVGISVGIITSQLRTFLNPIKVGAQNNTICYDTDGGENYYEKGTASSGGKSVDDICLASSSFNTEVTSSAILLEADCGMAAGIQSGHSGLGGSSYQCPYGCEDGACIAPPEGRDFKNMFYAKQTSQTFSKEEYAPILVMQCDKPDDVIISGTCRGTPTVGGDLISIGELYNATNENFPYVTTFSCVGPVYDARGDYAIETNIICLDSSHELAETVKQSLYAKNREQRFQKDIKFPAVNLTCDDKKDIILSGACSGNPTYGGDTITVGDRLRKPVFSTDANKLQCVGPVSGTRGEYYIRGNTLCLDDKNETTGILKEKLYTKQLTKIFNKEEYAPILNLGCDKENDIIISGVCRAIPKNKNDKVPVGSSYNPTNEQFPFVTNFQCAGPVYNVNDSYMYQGSIVCLE